MGHPVGKVFPDVSSVVGRAAEELGGKVKEREQKDIGDQNFGGSRQRGLGRSVPAYPLVELGKTGVEGLPKVDITSHGHTYVLGSTADFDTRPINHP